MGIHRMVDATAAAPSLLFPRKIRTARTSSRHGNSGWLLERRLSAAHYGRQPKNGRTRMDVVVDVEHLGKSYGSLRAVDDVTFQVHRGEIFGILGPNGAGKTTTIECLIGLRRPDQGTLRVLGLDPALAGPGLQRRIGVQLQSAALQDRIKVREAVALFSTLYDVPDRTEPLLREWGLWDRRDAAFGDLSGGQRQRLFITLALLNEPELVVLDELTTGLDPGARRATWDLIRSIQRRGATVLLVTHSMEEAESLCDRVAIIDRGRVRALGAPAELVGSGRTATRVRFTEPAGFSLALLEGVRGAERVTRDGAGVLVEGDGPLLVYVAERLARLPDPPVDLRSERSTLEETFLSLVGETKES
ncbi:MAG: ABC transporter ATP-binding protein [Gemmatimonadota bacterium]